MREKVFDLLERTALLHLQNAITVEVYGSAGTQLYKGNIMNVPFHICWNNVESWDMENYHMIINLL